MTRRFILLVLAALVFVGCARRRQEEPEPKTVAPAPAADIPFLLEAQPAEATLVQGGRSKFKIKVTPKSYSGPVTLEVKNLPGKITSAPVNLAGGQTVAELELASSFETKPGRFDKVYLFGAGVAGSNKSYSTHFPLTVLEAPFSVKLATDKIYLARGDKTRIPVSIKRRNFDGPVTVEVLSLPSGVKSAKVTIPAKQNEGQLVVTAAESANETDAKTMVVASGQSHLGGAAQPIKQGFPFQLIVQGPPFTLQTVLKDATVPFTSGKTKVAVLISRRDYQGPISLEVQKLPEHASAAKVVVPAGQNSAEVEITAPPAAPASKSQVSIVGHTTVANPRHASTAPFAVAIEGPPFDVRLEPAQLAVVQGMSATWTVHVKRKNYDGLIKVELRNLSRDLEAGGAAIVRGQDSVKIEVKAAENATPGARGGIQAVATALSFGKNEILSPAHAVQVLPPFALQVIPDSIQLLEGNKTKVTVLVKRHAYQGPIELEWFKLPASVSAAKTTIADKQTTVDVELAAIGNAPASTTTDIKVVGTSTNDKRFIVAPITLVVGQRPFELKVRPDFLTLAFGDKGTVHVTAQRKSYDGPIAVSLNNLPAGVKGGSGTIPAGKTDIDLPITVPIDGKAESKTGVHALGAAGNRIHVASNNFRIDIKPGLFDLGLQPAILSLTLGNSGKVTVKATRRGYKGPIAIDLKNLPAGVKASRTTLTPDQTETDIEVQADFAAKQGDACEVFARGTATLLDRQIASPHITVAVGSFGEVPALVVKTPAKLEILTGSTAIVPITLDRKSHKGPVTIEVRNLPPGIESSKAVIAEGQTSGEVVLTAANKVDVAVVPDLCAVGTAMVAGMDHAYASAHFTLVVSRK